MVSLRMIAGAPLLRRPVVISGIAIDRNAFVGADRAIDPDLHPHLDAAGVGGAGQGASAPIVKVRSNAHPLIWPLEFRHAGAEKLLSLVRGRELSDLPIASTGRPLDAVELERRASRVLAATDFAITARAAVDAIAAEKPRSVFVEQQLYDGFALLIRPRSSPSITSTMYRARCLSGSHSPPKAEADNPSADRSSGNCSCARATAKKNQRL